MIEIARQNNLKKSMARYRRNPGNQLAEGSWGMQRSGSLSYSTSFYDLLTETGEMNRRLHDLFNAMQTGDTPFLHGAKQIITELALNTIGDHLGRYVAEMKEQGSRVVILDLMGYGAILRKLNVPGAAVALADNRTQKEKDDDASHNRVFIPGDILSSKTWKTIHTYMEQQNSRFDVILCRPQGALGAMPSDLGVYRVLLNRMYPLLNPDGGFLVTQFHRFHEHAIRAFSDAVNMTPGITSKASDSAFLLARGNESPDALPA